MPADPERANIGAVAGAVAHAAFLDHLEGAVADLLEVLTRGRGPEEREGSAVCARSLHRVVDIHEVRVQQRPLAVTVHEPQILERCDVTEVPYEGAHQRRVNSLELLAGERGD